MNTSSFKAYKAVTQDEEKKYSILNLFYPTSQAQLMVASIASKHPWTHNLRSQCLEPFVPRNLTVIIFCRLGVSRAGFLLGFIATETNCFLIWLNKCTPPARIENDAL